MEHREFSRSGMQTAELFREINSVLNQRMRQSFQEVGLTPPQMMILHYLYNHNGCMVSDISQDLHLAASTVSSILDRLERNDFITRQRKQADKRVVQVILSQRALDWKDSLRANLDGTMERMVRNATDDELEQIISGLQLMKDVLNRNIQTEEGEEPHGDNCGS
ncbi:MarR family transcriptional regulator CosR [Barrientosiimonas marina]|uniref:MarR family winged helix-turn-helix transcriptional regulator n=1 Tax=Lentibacillus kimchii TaxID=1542911 RepID=A0ABW2UV53_9BACI